MADAYAGAAFARLLGLYAGCLAAGFGLKRASRLFRAAPAGARPGPGIGRKFKVFFAFQLLMLGLSFWHLPSLALFFALLFALAAREILALRTAGFPPGKKFEPAFAFGVLALFFVSLLAFHLFAGACVRDWTAEGFPFLAFVFLLVAVCDGFSQITGEILGGPKIVPRLSPGKTWSGFLGGVLFGAVVALIGNALFGFLSPLAAAALGLGVGLLAFFGDITASWAKRRMGLKDFSTLLGPQGGVLDRGDSLLWLGPALVASLPWSRALLRAPF